MTEIIPDRERGGGEYPGTPARAGQRLKTLCNIKRQKRQGKPARRRFHGARTLRSLRGGNALERHGKLPDAHTHMPEGAFRPAGAEGCLKLEEALGKLHLR